MTLLIAGVLGVFAFLSALACDALRDFSYSRLEDLCVRRQKPERFSVILRVQEPALLACELLLTLSLLALAVTLFLRVGWPVDGNAAAMWSAAVEYLVMATLILFVTNIVPWVIGHVGGEPFLYAFWPAISALLLICQPLILVARQLDRIGHRVSGRGESEANEAEIIAEEIRTVVDESNREGLLEAGARAMIHRVMELQDEDVRAIMTPRTNMFTIDVDTSLDEARHSLLEAGHSRVPVVGESTDDIVGILYAKDLLKAIHPANHSHPPLTLREIVREPFYVPEATSIPNLLESMKREHVQMAVVLDEYGGVAGLVTMEDILEEIVGEIADEYDREEHVQQIHPVSANVIEVDARVHLDDLNERFEYDLPEDEDFDTIGGFVFAQLGRIPEPGETVTWHQLRITVLDADKRKITRLRIEVDPSLAATAAEEA